MPPAPGAGYNAAMFQTAFRILLTVIWLGVGVTLLGRDALLPAEWVAGRNPTALNLMGVLALVLAAYNVLRLFLVRRRHAPPRPAANPLKQPRPDAPREYNPELDFTGQGPPADGPRPPAGG